ncbi:hypothetical protein HM1_1520 [Heliomicrobium modesticaldum Ice1]|uniref:Uncharacterized protein n=1 Tax=Heliobacterium modesticaldum (strain ATCC 51547 / Ice1) TaxID=498761 RepID=B0TCR6_HELMI|nr:hypothetical protein HM1_1520 [Heliomicrobium modesticaldum Ice1]
MGRLYAFRESSCKGEAIIVRNNSHLDEQQAPLTSNRYL